MPFLGSNYNNNRQIGIEPPSPYKQPIGHGARKNVFEQPGNPTRLEADYYYLADLLKDTIVPEKQQRELVYKLKRKFWSHKIINELYPGHFSRIHGIHIKQTDKGIRVSDLREKFPNAQKGKLRSLVEKLAFIIMMHPGEWFFFDIQKEFWKCGLHVYLDLLPHNLSTSRGKFVNFDDALFIISDPKQFISNMDAFLKYKDIPRDSPIHTRIMNYAKNSPN